MVFSRISLPAILPMSMPSSRILPFNVLKGVVDRNVTVYHMALTDRTSDVELVVPRGPKGWTNNGASLDRKREGHFAIVKVPGSRIDDLNLKDIGFIKIDVEGHENVVLKGAIATLQRDRPNLLLENEYAHVGAAADDVFRLLRDLNYDGFFLGDGVVKHISHFSWEQYQIGPRRESGKVERYVKNFIFIPKECPLRSGSIGTAMPVPSRGSNAHKGEG